MDTEKTKRKTGPRQRSVEQGGLLHLTAQNRSALTAGLDEAGRGCLAGPVVAAAVIFADGFDIMGLDDSKLIKSPEERQRLAAEIRALAPAWGVGMVWMKDIERHNILQASLLAMTRALAALRSRFQLIPTRLLIDGNQIIPQLYFKQYAFESPQQEAIIDGDALVPCISAASILAKTVRDDLMTRLDSRWPEYGFAQHKGYGTKEHREALKAHGPCPLHRLDFKGVLPEIIQEQARLW